MSDPDFRIIDRRIDKALDDRGLKGSGGDSGGDGIGKRVDKLEAKLDSLIKDVAEIKGRLAQMPTTFQLIGLTFGMIFAVMGSSFAVLRFGLPH